MIASRALNVALVGNSDPLRDRLQLLGWTTALFELERWLSVAHRIEADVALVRLAETGPDTWLRLHHLVPRVSYPLVLLVDEPVPASFHFPRAGVRAALLPLDPSADVLRSTVTLARHAYCAVREESDDAGPEKMREGLFDAVHAIQDQLDALKALADPSRARGSSPLLGDREREVFVLLLQGLSASAVAERLGIAESTAKKHIHAIYRKKGVANRAELMAGG